ncbi:(2Fe-2S) ferredoxin domain-containing protein [Undibacterium sp. RTI2.1]|uniref:(2Fe-2S) ferredoxin domain-containing protein n=1 Tax=unclassified Undibacterium TaxID=2630295 RepID=UPI002AB56CF7|nr:MULTISPECIES: (2Fe-2S) ferredoxin domain-containing protein [unclassified Undibacterium]MDY7539311.1 (2Fe-2S) ferredoxin domain-containing protein [Undibacterium sp. 5I1]MEB0031413.1 (2Fe-2S) ferredoxin domain-containing protein [Undibacterium sp. RTI2.1]MEB0117756.1 (2Fe-2S) ferredoxin domain-containing protein [Undibacterium sp. RTI2.2]MEB0232776.1 (2Fe-2S) ferredoxin domain-containing protein [Undibacterium sp. 10I3]MEB0259528.1 (2Fe-2S) ferredoxin domain-containing protein [Undibacteriu
MADTLNNPKTPDAPYFEKHVFFCMNQREDGRPCCADRGAQAAQEHTKKRIKQLNLSGHGKIRINKAGCLDRCEEGPVMVIYPQGTWYTFVDQSDIDEIIEVDLVGGGTVERLKI